MNHINHIVFVEVGNKQSSDPKKPGKEIPVREHPMFKKLECTIDLMKRDIAETSFKLQLLERFRDSILESSGNKEEKPEAPPKEQEETKAPKAVPENTQEREAPKQPKKADEENPSDRVNMRREILKVGIKRAVNAYKKAPLSKRYREPKRINRLLELSIKQGSGLTDNEHIVRMEAAIGEALTFLQNSPLAARSKSLMEARKILEETMDKRTQA